MIRTRACPREGLIGEIPPEMQAHLLRLLDAGGEYHRLGESSARRADVRLVCATNRELSALKHDLLARLKVRIAVPPLVHRREDIPLIARHLVSEPLDASLVTTLMTESLHTNVRELEEILLRAKRTS